MSALALKGEEREVALAEVAAVRDAVPAGDYRSQLDALHAALDGGAVEPEDTVELERLVTIALQSGRVRALYGPGGEQALLRLFRRLPGGVELTRSAGDVTAALEGLQGKPLEQATVSVIGPGSFALTLAAGGVTLNIRLDRQGARLASVEA